MCLILLAGFVSFANLVLLPYVDSHPKHVQRWLSEQVGQPIQFEKSKSQWTRRGPRIQLTNLRVGKENESVEIKHAELLVALYSGILPNHPLTELKISRLKLHLQQTENQQWVLLGVPKQKNASGDALDVLSGFGELQIEQSEITVSPYLQEKIFFPRMDARLRVQGQWVTVGLSAQSKLQQAPIIFTAHINRNNLAGNIWIGAKHLQSQHWQALFPKLKLPALESDSSFNIWMLLKDGKIERAHSNVEINNLALAKPSKKLFSFNSNTIYDSIHAESYWQRNANGWTITVPELRFKKDKKLQEVSDLRMRMQHQQWFAQVKKIDIEPASVILEIAKAHVPKELSWLQKAKVRGEFTQLSASGRSDLTSWKLSGVGQELGFDAIGNAPGVQHVSGVFRVDDSGGRFRFVNSKPIIDWSLQFGKPVASEINGALSWWRSGPDWVVGARNLNWRAEGLDILFDTEMQFYASNQKPMLNIAAKIKAFNFITAKRFWLQHSMPPATIKWLNMALNEGGVQNASVQVAGDLNHWPFTDKAGRFSAKALVHAKQLKFSEQWPAASNARLQVDFNGPGFVAMGNADYMGNALLLKPSGIESFSHTDLSIDVETKSRFTDLMRVVQNTPVKAMVGNPVSSLQGVGNTGVDLHLLIPIHKLSPPISLLGNLDFEGVNLRAPLWNITMQDVRGKTVFDQHGFLAKNLHGVMDKSPVQLEIRVGNTHVMNKANAVESLLSGEFNTEYLLNFDPSLSDLKSMLRGKSAWQFLVNVPTSKDISSAPVLLKAQSNLLGTEVQLPAPLKKEAQKPQALSVAMRVPAQSGLIDIQLGSEFRMQLKKPVDKPIAGVVMLGGVPLLAVPNTGIVVRGETDEFDVPAWLMLANKAKEGIGLQSFDLNVKHMRLLGEDFLETRLLRVQTPNAFTMRAVGENIDGQLSVPDNATQTIQAHFTKVHIPHVVKTKSTQSEPISLPTTNLDYGNPANMQAIKVTVDDLRYGELQLGRADMQTISSKQGMLIQKFSTQSPSLSINATGYWQGEGKMQRSSFQANIASADLGKLMNAAHYGNMISRGKISTQLSGSWSGSPMDFSLHEFNGVLALDVKEGQILNVEPGGGRVLGLMSLTELPRRLSLDFRDFFNKGLAFKQIKGQFAFSKGLATTQDLMINAPAAEIKITGSTDLVREQFNQRVLVQPRAGSILPVIGAATAGPIGAAAGALAQAVLNKPLKEGTATEYQITGPWEKPDVKKITVEKRK